MVKQYYFDEYSPEFLRAVRYLTTTPREKFDPSTDASLEKVGECLKWIDCAKKTRSIDIKAVFAVACLELGYKHEDQHRFYRILQDCNEPKTLAAIVKCIYDYRLIHVPSAFGTEEAKRDGNFYHAMLEFLGIKHDTRTKTADAVTGTYQLWRHSTSTPGYYTKGAVSIAQDVNANAVRVRMLQRSTPKLPDSKHLSPGPKQWNDGYIFRRSGEKHYVMMLTDDRSNPALNRGGLRLAIFRTMQHGEVKATRDVEGKEVVLPVFSMEGFVLGIDESKTIFSPVYMERVDQPDIDAYEAHCERDNTGVNTYSPEETPPRILAILGRHTGSAIRD